jgi:hypothetical protein
MSCSIATGATTFWVGIYAEAAANFAYQATTGGTARWRYNLGAFGTPPSTFTGGSLDGDYNAYNFEAYVTY